MEIECELDQPVWAVATQSRVLATDLTYPEAIDVVNENLGVSGIAIITAESAERQIGIHNKE